MARTRVIKQRYFIRAPVDKVFRALTEPRLLKKWFLSAAQLSPRRGGNYTFAWQGGYSHTARVLSYTRDKLLSLSWPQEKLWKGRPLGTTRATFRLKASEDGTILDVTHAGFKNGRAWLETYGDACGAWAYYLTNLKSVLEQNRDLRSHYDSV